MVNVAVVGLISVFVNRFGHRIAQLIDAIRLIAEPRPAAIWIEYFEGFQDRAVDICDCHDISLLCLVNQTIGIGVCSYQTDTVQIEGVIVGHLYTCSHVVVIDITGRAGYL